jgi:hypothetical protein
MNLPEILDRMILCRTNKIVPKKVFDELEKLKELDAYWYTHLTNSIKKKHLDVHCWLKDKTTGNIIDPTPEEPHIKVIMDLNSCSSKDRVYDEIQNFEVANIIHRAMWHFAVKQEYKDGTLSKYDQEPKPQPSQCSFNVFAKYMFNENYSKEHTVICYGKMGFRKHDGTIHWEYG